VTFWEHFLRLLPHRPKPALAALYWHLTRRRVRARNRLRVASADLPFVYAAWINQNERSVELADLCASLLADGEWLPRFAIVLHSPDDYSDEQLGRSQASIERQIYPHWKVADAIGVAAEVSAEADFIVPLRIGDELSRGALFRFAEAAGAKRGASILYGDEDYLDARGRRHRPWFKPRWNEEMFLALDFVSSASAMEANLFREVVRNVTPSDVSALFLGAISQASGAIVHVPHIVTHAQSRREPPSGRVEAVARHLEPLGGTCGPGLFGTVKVQWPLPTELPLVSIIIPIRDKPDLLRACVEGVLQRTDYRNFEILIVDNQSVEERTLSYLDELDSRPDVRVIPFPKPFNFSAITNLAAREAKGSFLCLLNNDTEVIEPKWLTELMRYAVKPEIGAAGAKLLYEDGSIQHAGIVIGIGEAAGHAHRFLPAGKMGYFRMPHVPHFISAVTAACLVIEKSKFDAVEGFDEELAVAFNDVDFCLKVQAAGWRNVYVPHAVLLHHESKSRGKDVAPENAARFQRELETLQHRWGTVTYVDPVQNPNLDRYSETYVIGL
jgi:GT2 family glycosyltransferase